MDYKDVLKSEYFKNTYEKIEDLKKDFYVNHGFIHIDGVIESAKYLADVFNLTSKQKQLLLIAAALHDIGYLMGREGHAKNGGLLAYEFLKDKMSKNDVDVICKAIASHGGKNEEDYICPISRCLILADKFDFTQVRYRDDGKEHSSLPLFKSVKKVKLAKSSVDNYKLNIYTTAKELFGNLSENYFFVKLSQVLQNLEKVCGCKVEMEIVDIGVFEKK